MDHYIDENNAAERLYQEWVKYGQIIIAYDYDNTVFDYHGEGHSYENVIALLRECREIGAYMYVFTSCEEEKFPEMEKYLKDNDIPYDSINEAPSFIPFKGKKPYFNILLDDRAGLRAAYQDLSMAASRMRDAPVEKMWHELTDVPFDEDFENQELYLADDWKHFKAGTYREDIWRWFDQNHSRGVAFLMRVVEPE